jgi:hypothetical protein
VLKVLHAAERVLGAGGRFRYLHQVEDASDRVAILEFEEFERLGVGLSH